MAAARAGETLIDTLCNQYSIGLVTKIHTNVCNHIEGPYYAG